MDFSKDMSYGDYLGLDQLLKSQNPRSDNHNEMLFIIQHQTSELWMKLILHELHAALAELKLDALNPVFKKLSRISRIMEQLVQAWNVLATMTPPEYSAIRPFLGSSSGFQSFQYREIEFLLGNKNPALVQPHLHAAHRMAPLQGVLNSPSLYDEAIILLKRRGFDIREARLQAALWQEATICDDSVENAWLEVYRNPEKHWDLYHLAEDLVDLEDAFRLWRFRHLTTVDRIIGFKRGTGGTQGVSYLKSMLDVVLFPELWKLRTHL